MPSTYSLKLKQEDDAESRRLDAILAKRGIDFAQLREFEPNVQTGPRSGQYTIPGHAFLARIKEYLADPIKKTILILMPQLRSPGMTPQRIGALLAKHGIPGIPEYCFYVGTEKGFNRVDETAANIAAGKRVPNYDVLSALAKNFGLSRDERFDFLVEGIDYIIACHDRLKAADEMKANAKAAGVSAQETPVPTQKNTESKLAKALRIVMDSRHIVNNNVGKGPPDEKNKGKKVSASALRFWVSQSRLNNLLAGTPPKEGDRGFIGNCLDALDADSDQRKNVIDTFESDIGATAADPASPPGARANSVKQNRKHTRTRY